MNTMKRYIALCMAVLTCAAAGASVGAQGWTGDEGESEYIRADGSTATGIVVIEGTAYYFLDDGSPAGRYTGITNDKTGARYYVDGEAFRNGWQYLPNGTYYFDESGRAKTGTVEIDGQKYSFDAKGRLKTSDNKSAYTITADKSTVTSGSAEKITVTIKADGLSNMAYIMPDVRLQRYADTSWVRVKPNTTLNPVIIGKAQLGKISETEYSRSAKLVFTPDLYAEDIAPGHYRLAIPVSAGTKTITLYHEFDITKNGFSTADKQAYDIRSTQKISFETYLNKDENVYPRVNELYFREDGKWVLVSPKKGREFASGTVSAKGGSTYTSVLDLTRYDKTELKTGRYMVYVGDGIRSEFRLTNPVDVEAYQIPAQNKGNIKVRLTLHCRKYDSVDITKYGELYYYSNGKWEKMESKKTYLPGDLHLEKGMVYMQDYLITDFYKARGMKSGRYAIRLYTSTGEYADVYFDLEIEEQ